MARRSVTAFLSPFTTTLCLSASLLSLDRSAVALRSRCAARNAFLRDSPVYLLVPLPCCYLLSCNYPLPGARRVPARLVRPRDRRPPVCGRHVQLFRRHYAGHARATLGRRAACLECQSSFGHSDPSARLASLKAQGAYSPHERRLDSGGVVLPALKCPQDEGLPLPNRQAGDAIDPAWFAAYAAASDLANQPSQHTLPPGVPSPLAPPAAATARADHSFVSLPPPPEPPPPPSQPPGSPPPSPLPPLPQATDLCYNCTLVCVAPYAALGSLSTTPSASLRFEFGYGEEAVAVGVSPEDEGGASKSARLPPRYLSPLSQHESELLAPLDAPTDEFGGSFAPIRVTAVSASTEEPSKGRGAAHIVDGSGLRQYVESTAYDGTPPVLY